MATEDHGPIRRSVEPLSRAESDRGRLERDIERAERNPHLRDHLSQSERIRVGARRHPIVLAKPALLALAALALLLRSLTDSDALTSTRQVFLVLFLVAAGWLGVRWLQWSRHFFLATDQRVLKMYGLFSTTVDSMKVQKVTDMKYHRSLLGEIIGYGSITIESAGQDQALHDIDFIPYPRENYQELCHVILGEEPRAGGRKKHRFRRRIESMTRRRDGWAGSEQLGHSDPYDPGGHEPATQDPGRGQRVLYSSTEGRTAETSPIPVFPPGHFSVRDDSGHDDDDRDDPTRP